MTMHRPHSKNKTWTGTENGLKEDNNNDGIAEDPNLPGNKWKHVSSVSAGPFPLRCDVYLWFF